MMPVTPVPVAAVTAVVPMPAVEVDAATVVAAIITAVVRPIVARTVIVGGRVVVGGRRVIDRRWRSVDRNTRKRNADRYPDVRVGLRHCDQQRSAERDGCNGCQQSLLRHDSGPPPR